MRTGDHGSRAAEVDFRLRTLQTGIWPSFFSCAALAVYYALTWDRPNRDVLCALWVVAVLATIAVGRLPVARWIRGRGREPFFVGWSVSLIAMIGAGAAVDGGASSPLIVLLFMPLAYSALSYPLPSMLVVGAVDVVAYVLLAVFVGGVSTSTALLTVAALLNATWICAWQSRNHDRQREELARVSRSDALTGALNRRGFEERFDAELARARRDATPLALVVVDLDHFKAVNDSRGHAAGDRLLCAVAEVLTTTVRGADTVGRLGGDEFGVLLVGGDGDVAAERISRALLDVSPATIGVARFPLDGMDAAELHQAADAELYARKHGRQRADGRTPRDLSWAAALAATVDRRMAVSHQHGTAVAALAAGIASRLGWQDQDLDDLRLAATLHDVGKVCVPGRILRKPGPLDEDEWAEVRKHPVAGADIVATIDGLDHIAPWIRHSHEHVDGSGYPDALTGDAIPQAARILLVADAFDAMTSDRTYRRALDRPTALAELRRHAGTQFDAACVNALERHLSGPPVELPISI